MSTYDPELDQILYDAHDITLDVAIEWGNHPVGRNAAGVCDRIEEWRRDQGWPHWKTDDEEP